MLLSNVEYVPLRLLRRFVLREGLLLRFGAFLPYYRTNLNQADPARLADAYQRNLASARFSPTGLRLLEIGVGRTNSVAYEMSARFETQAFTVFEPFVGLSPAEDSKLLLKVAARHNRPADDLATRVHRIARLEAIEDGSINLILSSSVLEHVGDPRKLFARLRRILAPGGAMLHLVDYRDHFFKYPYHFLQFRKATWNRWLNPGDLPVWRLYDHLDQLEETGFSARVLEESSDPEAFAAIAAHVSADYPANDERLKTTTAAIWAVANPA